MIRHRKKSHNIQRHIRQHNRPTPTITTTLLNLNNNLHLLIQSLKTLLNLFKNGYQALLVNI